LSRHHAPSRLTTAKHPSEPAEQGEPARDGHDVLTPRAVRHASCQLSIRQRPRRSRRSGIAHGFDAGANLGARPGAVIRRLRGLIAREPFATCGRVSESLFTTGPRMGIRGHSLCAGGCRARRRGPLVADWRSRLVVLDPVELLAHRKL
jgi:hypothetical protein